jgi:hypothetical protein
MTFRNSAERIDSTRDYPLPWSLGRGNMKGDRTTNNVIESVHFGPTFVAPRHRGISGGHYRHLSYAVSSSRCLFPLLATNARISLVWCTIPYKQRTCQDLKCEVSSLATCSVSEVEFSESHLPTVGALVATSRLVCKSNHFHGPRTIPDLEDLSNGCGTCSWSPDLTNHNVREGTDQELVYGPNRSSCETSLKATRHMPSAMKGPEGGLQRH